MEKNAFLETLLALAGGGALASTVPLTTSGKMPIISKMMDYRPIESPGNIVPEEFLGKTVRALKKRRKDLLDLQSAANLGIGQPTNSIFTPKDLNTLLKVENTLSVQPDRFFPRKSYATDVARGTNALRDLAETDRDAVKLKTELDLSNAEAKRLREAQKEFLRESQQSRDLVNKLTGENIKAIEGKQSLGVDLAKEQIARANAENLVKKLTEDLAKNAPKALGEEIAALKIETANAIASAAEKGALVEKLMAEGLTSAEAIKVLKNQIGELSSNQVSAAQNEIVPFIKSWLKSPMKSINAEATGALDLLRRYGRRAGVVGGLGLGAFGLMHLGKNMLGDKLEY